MPVQVGHADQKLSQDVSIALNGIQNAVKCQIMLTDVDRFVLVRHYMKIMKWQGHKQNLVVFNFFQATAVAATAPRSVPQGES